MTGTFYTDFKKRKNSTKQPTGGTSKTFTLKEGTSIEKPVFLLNSNTFNYNYVNAFGHYYFVDDVKSVRNNLIEVSCSMDVLATYKSDIGSYQAFVERAASSYDPWLPDQSLAMTPYCDVSENSGSAGLSSVGCFAVSVINTKGSGAGFTTTYIMDTSNVEALANYVNTDWGSAAADILGWLQATFLKTANSIISCIWLPVSTGTVAALSNVSYEVVEVGVDAIPSVHGYRLTGTCIAHFTGPSISMPTPQFPNDFRSYPPYTVYKIYIPGYGMLDLNKADFPYGVAPDIDVDISTGDTWCYLETGTTRIATVHYNLGVQCPIGSISNNLTDTVVGIIQSRMNVVSADVPGNRYADVSKLEAAAAGVNAFSAFAGV